MTRYASNTSVSAAKSRDEIESTLIRYGATGFMYGWEDRDGESMAVVGFKIADRQMKFLLPMPDKNDPEFWSTPEKRLRRKPDQAQKAWEQATRQRWRALALVIKAKLEAVESGITTIDSEFLAHIVLPDGSTVEQFMLPQVQEAYASGAMPRMLPALPEASS